MQSIAWGMLDVALSNAAVAAAAAVLVWIVTRVLRKPALGHALWLIVLLKLMTPPIWSVPIHIRHTQPLAVTSGQHENTVAPTARSGEICVTATPGELATTIDAESNVRNSNESTEDQPAIVMSAPESAATPSAPPATADLAPASSIFSQIQWTLWLAPGIVGLWATISILWLLISGLRIVHFHRTLRFSLPAPPELQREADRLARCMGIKGSARVWLVPGAVCPMLWGIGKARVLVPRELWGRLDRRQRHTLLVHELAHLRRRDHWVRYVELLATALYWWNPICWWARHELREAEEQCCDAWVMDMMPGAFREYAHALLEAVDFISADGGAPRRDAVPTLASGMGQFGHLKRRLTMLKQGQVARALGWGGWSAAVGVGALLLPLTPTLGQEKETKKPAEVTQKASEVKENVSVVATSTSAANKTPAETVQVSVSDEPAAPEALPPAPAAPGVAPIPGPPLLVDQAAPSLVPVAPSPLASAADADNEDEKGNSDDARNRDRDFRRQMQDVQRQQAGQQRQQAGQQRAQAELKRAERDVQMLSQRLQEATARLQKLQSQMQQNFDGKGQINLEAAPNPLTQPEEFKAYIKGQVSRAQADMKAATKDGKALTFTFRKDGDGNNGPRAGVMVRPRGNDDERMDRLEKQLSELMKEVRDLRRERQRGSSDNRNSNNANKQEYQRDSSSEKPENPDLAK